MLPPRIQRPCEHLLARHDVLVVIESQHRLCRLAHGQTTVENGRLDAHGRLRGELVVVLDVTEAEADKLLATFDPISAMAEADT